MGKFFYIVLLVDFIFLLYYFRFLLEFKNKRVETVIFFDWMEKELVGFFIWVKN